MKNKLWEMAKPALILMLIAAVSSAALAGVNALTAGTIARRAEETANAALHEVLDADVFEAATLVDGDKPVTYHIAKGDNGEILGYVFVATVTGKSSGLTVMTGIFADGTVSGVTVVEDNETAGYLDRVKKAGLFSLFDGKRVDSPFVADRDIDTVAQATKTSKGVIAGVNRAVMWYAQLVKGGDTGGTE